MTREEAITYLNVIWNRYKAEYEIERETLDAYHMAIDALSNEKSKADERNIQSGDLISRADAIEAVHDACNYCDTCDLKDIGCSQILSLKEVPSAEAVQGEWIEKYNGNGWNDFWDYTCSNCGKKYERADAVLYHANYCPNCGARMNNGGDSE